MEKLYKFFLDCKRMGEVEGVFIAHEEDVEKAMGKTIYFGEILGKHSDIECVLSTNVLNEVTSDPEFIRMVRLYGIQSGYNPLEYVVEDEEDECECSGMICSCGKEDYGD